MAGHLENTRAIDKITYVTDAVPTWWMEADAEDRWEAEKAGLRAGWSRR